MEDLLDVALNRVLAMSPKERKDHVATTVAEEMALKFFTIGLDDGDLSALRIIAERTGGRATQRLAPVANDIETLTEKVQQALGGL